MPEDPEVSRAQFWVGKRPWPEGVYATGPTCRCGHAIRAHPDLAILYTLTPRILAVKPGDWIIQHASGRRSVERDP